MKYSPLSKNDAACLLVDHQSGLCNRWSRISRRTSSRTTCWPWPICAKYFKLPTILTTSFENGPNGPLVPELKETVSRRALHRAPGNINAWDNEDFVKAVKATGQQATASSPASSPRCAWPFPRSRHSRRATRCSWSPTLRGRSTRRTRDAAWSRMAAAGAQLMSWFGVACELHRDWRNDIEGLGALFSEYIPNYRNLITSYLAKK